MIKKNKVNNKGFIDLKIIKKIKIKIFYNEIH